MDELMVLPMAHRQQSILNAVQNYSNRLFSFIHSRVKNNEDAEDILQDVWYKLSSISDIEPIEQMSSWLYRVSRNRITDKKRKQKTLSLEDLAYENEDGEMVYPEALLSGSIESEPEFERAYFMELIIEAMNELPDKQREVLVWNELEELTLQEIADKTGESIKTIISRKRYAIAYLRKRLQEIYNEY
jgi:RNA polymerase sigma factor (sigma-70 family)